jgi:hypothetical protein
LLTFGLVVWVSLVFLVFSMVFDVPVVYTLGFLWFLWFSLWFLVRSWRDPGEILGRSHSAPQAKLHPIVMGFLECVPY